MFWRIEVRLRYIFCKDIRGYSKQRYILGLFMYKRRENEYMKKRTIRFCCGVMAAGLLICGIPSGGAEGVTQNHLLWNVAAAAETAVTVSVGTCTKAEEYCCNWKLFRQRSGRSERTDDAC